MKTRNSGGKVQQHLVSPPRRMTMMLWWCVATVAALLVVATTTTRAVPLSSGGQTTQGGFVLKSTLLADEYDRAAAYALSQQGHRDPRAVTEPPLSCKVVNYETGNVVFDLSPLFRKPGEANHVVRDDDGNVYYLNVCGYVNAVGGAKRCTSQYNDTHISGCQDMPGTSKPPLHIGTESIPPALVNPAEPSEGVTLLFSSDATHGAACESGARPHTKILFTCGPSRGRPVFLNEGDECSFTFRWETDLVCEDADPSVEELPCYVETDKGDIIDLSPLVSSVSNWRALDETHNADTYMYYLSVCRTLVPTPDLPAGCATSTSAACQYKTSESSRRPVSLGHPATPRYSNGEVSMTYTMGDSCGDTGIKRKAQIFFTCPTSRDKGLGSPKFREEINCYYIFDWETTAACVVGSEQSSGSACSVTDDNDNVFDFSPLKGKSYSVLFEDTTYEFGVCGAPVSCGIDGKKAAVCRTKGIHADVLATTTSGVSVTGGEVQVSYVSAPVSGDKIGVITTFVCDPAATPDASLEDRATLVDIVGTIAKPRVLLFEVQTSLVCVQEVECAIEANGRSYDLSPLTKDTYWRVDAASYSYLINVCKNVVAPSLGCEGTGGCQLLDDSKHTAYPLGTVSGPRIDGNNALVLEYTNGSKCGNLDISRSMTITFECDESAGVAGALTALEEKTTCHYEFLWQTSAACPVETDRAEGCRLTDEHSGQTFDLTNLASKLRHRDLHVSSTDATYHVGLCAPSSYCGDDVAVCDASRKSYGQATTELSYNQDSLFLTYSNGASCGNGQKKATTIQFKCAEGDGEDGPVVLSDDDCLLELEWPTRYACTEEFETMNCIAYHGDKRFDISRLLDSNANYFAEDAETGTTFLINVCRPMIPDSERLCPFGAAACAITHDKKAISLGKPGKEPVYDAEHDRVYIDYLNGTDGASSRIEFVCPEPSEDESTFNTLVYLGKEVESNKYLFRIRSKAACQRVLVRGSNCMVSDSITGMQMDLSPLRRDRPYEVKTPKYTYELNVCKAVPCADRKSSSSAGACQTDGSGNAYHLGEVNSEPLFDNNVLQLSYEHGHACHDKTVFRRTVILFVCDLEVETGEPEFLHEDNNCMYIFQWRTQHACKPQITHCGAIDPDTGAEYHLDALMRQDYAITVYDRGTASSSNWLALDNDDDPLLAKYAFRINVCRPLVPDSSISCAPFAAACQTNLDSRDHYTIGYPLRGPEVVDGRLQMQYPLGDSSGCPGHRTATIEFSCNPTPGDLGTPVFEFEGDHCDYHFSWSSSAACPHGGSEATSTTSTSSPGTGGDDDSGRGCKVMNRITGETIDLSGLGSDGLLHTRGYGKDGTEYDYYVGICQESQKSNQRECSGMGACQTTSGLTVGLGQANHHLFFEGDQLTLQYTDGKLCHGQYKRRTTLFIMCDHAETGAPRLEYIEETDDCEYRFEVYTALACSRVRQTSCTAIDFNQDTEPVAYDLSPLMQIDEDYAVEIPDPESMGGSLAVIDINVCRSLVRPRPGCENFYSVCMSPHGQRQGDPLGLPSSPYVTPDHQLRMDYVSPGCEFGDSPTTNTTIIFQCSADGETHQPVLVSPSTRETCEFLIVWETELACGPGGASGSDTTTTAAPGTLTRDDCVVSNEYDRFDLTTLGSAKADVENEADGEDYEYHVAACGTVPCRNTDGLSASVCQSDSESAWSLGQFTRRPVLEEGHADQVVLEYEDGSACGQKQRTSRVTFKCERNQARQGPVFVAETDTCEYEFTWYTDAVCPNQAIPHRPLGCSIADPETGRVYHLDELMRSNELDENWLARDAAEDEEGSSGFNFYINVCRPLVPSQIDSGVLSEVCRGSGVCQMTESGAAYSGGYAMHEPEFDANGDVVLRYSLPHSYETKCHGQFTRSASITFTCKEGTLGHPVFVGETAECEYQFVWETSVVCEYKQKAGSNCQVTDEETGTVFDLSPLQGTLARAEAGGYTYELAVCSAPIRESFSGCADDSKVGACQLKQDLRTYSYNLGEINAKPFVTDAGVALEYVHGQACHNHKFQRSTYIEFVCDSTAGDGAPVFVDELEDCSYVFRWPTAHVCERQTDFECVVTDKKGREYDLSALKRLDGNWMVDNTAQADEFTYVLNVCHNVIRTGQARNCSGNAGACQWSAESHGFYDLGHPAEPKFVGGQLQMVLEGGTPCNGKPRTTTVTFECKKPDGSGEPLGTPRFDHEDDCHYNILWETSAACPVNTEPDHNTDKCVFEDAVTGAVVDLTTISPSLLEFTDDRSMRYSFNPCATFSCGNTRSYACQRAGSDEFSLGSSKSVTVSDGAVSMHLTGGTRCPSIGQDREAFITFECPEDGTSETSSLVSVNEEHTCSYGMVVRTPAACGLAPRQCIVKDNTHEKGWEYDLSPLSVDGAITVKTDDGQIDFNVCRGVSRAGCPSNAGACLTIGNEHYALGLYTEDTQPEMMQDKPQVHLMYTGGECPHGSHASVEIIFVCPADTSKPKSPTLVRSTGCVYQIEWETCRVCPGQNPCEDVRTTHAPGTHGEGSTAAQHTTHSGAHDGTDTSSGSHKKKGVVAAVVIIVLIVVVTGTYLIMKPGQRASLLSCCGGGSSSGSGTSYVKLQSNVKEHLFSDSSSEEEALFGIGAHDSDDDSDHGDGSGSGGTREASFMAAKATPSATAATAQNKTALISTGSSSSGDDDDDAPLVPI
ncbi:hypothetical protein PTSG_04871 [Salpingoeca rosetta]|uniref:MRH domain-containing protein n=1 Tax=Salpingoeca rosetta (strain ATCC 50818 / BSB-021) TaxID=946362 RepID=F2U8V5_SALR5|nr:uncharacterized protein PTSG_04871 [Salpingoeca rosetta]EGD73158.1 hypothetical protein PTSG_04871 [Salpingoeca rosetta]|eukprot:XP_004994189.1 hypothetical protein PTSG_04871 [Salpingoeca rosetta]